MIEVKDLTMHYKATLGWVKAVNDVTFSLDKHESLGIVGESGAGKSSVAIALLRILPQNGVIRQGKVLVDGFEVLSLPGSTFRKDVRWKKISMIFQASMDALDPVYTVGHQLISVLRLHRNVSKKEARKMAEAAVGRVDLRSSILNSYPHELSGGMKQRVMIAMSFLLIQPSVVLADEPTSALDVLVEDRVLKQMKKLQVESDLSVVHISHNVSTILTMCDKMAVMYAGAFVEYGNVRNVFKHCAHPYTIGLLKAVPSLRAPTEMLVTIPGTPPSLIQPPVGCTFAPRCPLAASICRETIPPIVKLADDHWVRCHFARDIRKEDVHFGTL